jgi:hypothetical protein
MAISFSRRTVLHGVSYLVHLCCDMMYHLKAIGLWMNAAINKVDEFNINLHSDKDIYYW